MDIKKQIHSGYKEYQDTPKLKEILGRCIFGKYQYICTSKKGRISIIHLPNYLGDGYDWEIYGYEKLFDDVQRFKTLKEAKQKASEYLD